MAYDEFLAERTRQYLVRKNAEFYEKRMMGGLTFMVCDKMCVGVLRTELMVRIDPEREAVLLKKKGSREMDFTKRPMKGFLFIGPDGTDREADLAFWIDEALSFNPKAKASRK